MDMKKTGLIIGLTAFVTGGVVLQYLNGNTKSVTPQDVSPASRLLLNTDSRIINIQTVDSIQQQDPLLVNSNITDYLYVDERKQVCPIYLDKSGHTFIIKKKKGKMYRMYFASEGIDKQLHSDEAVRGMAEKP